MLQIIIQGRGGQGAQMAGKILAASFFREGKFVQAYATYGGARRGAPVSSFIRIDEKPIRLRCDIENPDALLCFDASLLNNTLLQGAKSNTMVLVNSSKMPEEFKELGNFKLFTVDGKKISHNNGLGRIVNSSLVGAFAGLLKEPDINNLLAVIKEISPVKTEENSNSCLEGYNMMNKFIKEREVLA